MELRLFKIGLTEIGESAGLFLVNRQIQKLTRYPCELQLDAKLVRWDNFQKLFDYVRDCSTKDMECKPFAIITMLDFVANRFEYYKEGLLFQDLRGLTLAGCDLPCYLEYPDFKTYEKDLPGIIRKENREKYNYSQSDFYSFLDSYQGRKTIKLVSSKFTN